MKRSEIENAIRVAQKFVGILALHCHPTGIGRAGSGRLRVPSGMRCGTACWAGMSPTSAADASRKSAACFSPCATADRTTRATRSPTEKLLIDPENQRAPAHFHRSKREDIICRHGGNILVQLTKAMPGGDWSDEPFAVAVNGCLRQFNPREIVRLSPGESVTIPPGTIHQFWAEEGTGWEFEGKRHSLSSEISSVCDDWNDNAFFDDWAARFPEIEEDVPSAHFLCSEYPLTKNQPSES